MMFHSLASIHRNQKGFTVLELLIAIAITAVVAGAATTTLFQVYGGSAYSYNHMTAVRQVQNAGYWVSLDGQTAQNIALTGEAVDDPDGTRFPLTLTWIDWDTIVHKVKYELVNMPNNSVLKNLQRKHYTDDTLNETGIVAQYINPDPTKTNCKLTTGAFSLPDIGDVCTISDTTGGDSGFIIVTDGSISVIPDGTATYDALTGVWTTPSGGDTVAITASVDSTSGHWTSTTGTATISTGDAILTDGGALILTVTSTVGTDSREQNETRAYEVISRPGS